MSNAHVFIFFGHGLPSPPALGGNLVGSCLFAMLSEKLFDLIADLANIEKEWRGRWLLGDLECIRPARNMGHDSCRLLLGLRLSLLSREDVHLVFHVGKVWQFVIEVAIEELNPQH